MDHNQLLDGEETLEYREAMQAASGQGKSVFPPRLEEMHGACVNIHTCVIHAYRHKGKKTASV